MHGRAVAFPDETRTAAGDGARRLYERHGRSVFAYCLRQLRDRADAEDATQATFLNAFRSMQRGVEPELEQAWLYTIAGRVCANRRRANLRRRRVETPTDLYDVEAHAQQAAEPEDFSHLAEALAALPEQQRKALLMRETEGLTYREIAEAFQLSQGAVEQLLFRARRSLTQKLAPAKQGKRAGGSLGGIQLGSLISRLKGFFFRDFIGGAAAAKAVVVGAALVGAAGAATTVSRPAPADRPVAAARVSAAAVQTHGGVVPPASRALGGAPAQLAPSAVNSGAASDPAVPSPTVPIEAGDTPIPSDPDPAATPPVAVDSTPQPEATRSIAEADSPVAVAVGDGTTNGNANGAEQSAAHRSAAGTANAHRGGVDGAPSVPPANGHDGTPGKSESAGANGNGPANGDSNPGAAADHNPHLTDSGTGVGADPVSPPSDPSSGANGNSEAAQDAHGKSDVVAPETPAAVDPAPVVVDAAPAAAANANENASAHNPHVAPDVPAVVPDPAPVIAPVVDAAPAAAANANENASAHNPHVVPDVPAVVPDPAPVTAPVTAPVITTPVVTTPVVAPPGKGKNK